MSEAEKYLYDRNYDDPLISGDNVMYVSELMEIFHKHQMSKELEEALKKSTGDLIQFVAVELRGEKLSDEDIESMIHDYVHPKKETKKE
ncbi:MAG: hypothetical protein NXH86_04145 [Flavobacteriaceae bacterium]|nr:hypothetical protein [Flavobacteriaceae bacterium]